MPTIQIDALDTLFFRDSKTFTKGEDTWADTMFPPYPSVIYGALRSAYFAENTSKLKDANIEGKDESLKLEINNICLKQGNELYFPLPLDCVQEKTTNKKDKVFVLKANPINNNISSNSPTNQILMKKDDTETEKDNCQIENPKQAIVGESALEKYLKGTYEKAFSIKNQSDYISLEPKIGIARSRHTHTSDDGMLYRVGMNRMAKGFENKLSLIIAFEGLVLLEKGLIKMGGEGKAVKYEDLKDRQPDFTLSDEAKKKIQENKNFKLYLSTPAIFENGWLPSWINENSLKGIIPNTNTEVQLLTAAIGKPVSIGGWDIKRGCPKTMRKAVPAGSVYYFELIEGNVEDLIKINSKSISDHNAKQGFGIAYVGAVK
ncbi:MAG: type III-B CRISPR module-associated protein Cmr3 [Cyanobacteriota bacterium]